MNSPFFSQQQSALKPHPRPPKTADDAKHPDFVKRRRQAFEAARQTHGSIDSLILCDPLDIQYLTGTSHGISWLVVGSNTQFAISRHMLVSEVRDEAVNCDILLASGGLLLVGVLLAFAMSARITRPLQRLRIAANALVRFPSVRLKAELVSPMMPRMTEINARTAATPEANWIRWTHLEGEDFLRRPLAFMAHNIVAVVLKVRAVSRSLLRRFPIGTVVDMR